MHTYHSTYIISQWSVSTCHAVTLTSTAIARHFIHTCVRAQMHHTSGSGQACGSGCRGAGALRAAAHADAEAWLGPGLGLSWAWPGPVLGLFLAWAWPGPRLAFRNSSLRNSIKVAPVLEWNLPARLDTPTKTAFKTTRCLLAGLCFDYATARVRACLTIIFPISRLMLVSPSRPP